MAGMNGNGAGYTPKLPTLDELRRIFEEGVEQTLLSGVVVKMRPVQPDRLLASGRVPDMLTPLMLKGLYGAATEEVTAFLQKPRDEKAEALEFIESVNAVCEAALLEPDLLPYLEFADRLWIFKLAFLPAEVLSRFRREPQRDVETEADSEGNEHEAERADDPLVQVDSLPV